MKHRARDLRRNQTDAEKLLWQRLRNRQLGGNKFRRQVVYGQYIVDFVCKETGVIIELDGGQHANQQQYDQQRSIFLASLGYNVKRYWNNDVLENTDSVLDDILTTLNNND